MKEISCSQCNALIEPISLPDKSAVCNYCGAKILIPDYENTASNQFLSNYNPTEKVSLFDHWVTNIEDDDLDENGNRILTVIGIILAAIAVIFLPFLLVKEFRAKNVKTENQQVNAGSPNSTPSQSEPTFPQKSVPNFSYRSTVEYAKNIGAEVVENPVIKMEKLPTNNLNELRKTVFAQNKIHVYLVINEDGNVVSAKAINGHPILQESSVEAAKKSMFVARKGKTTAIFTYVYILN